MSRAITGVAAFAAAAMFQAAHAEDAQSLLAEPKRLDEVLARCKASQSAAADLLCLEASKAVRLRFQGRGIQYTPQRVDPFPSLVETQPDSGKPEITKPSAKPRSKTEKRAE